MSNIGRVIQNGYCNGSFGRNYNLSQARIEAEGYDWVLIRTTGNEIEVKQWTDVSTKEKDIDEWCTDNG